MSSSAPLPTRDIVVMGASAGGVQVLLDVVRALPVDFPAAVFIVQHVPGYAISYLAELLDKASPLPARYPQPGEVVRPGTIYVAPPDHHLLLEGNQVLATRGPKENRFRPSVDALFRSAAYTYGPRVIGVVLTGYLDDGTSGLWTVQRLGGLTVVQDPKEAYVPDMPRNALQYTTPDYVVPQPELAPLLVRLTAQPAPAQPSVPPEELARIAHEITIAKGDTGLTVNVLREGELTPFVCPSCQGPLVKLIEGQQLRFRCRTGHGFTLSGLLAAVSEGVENQLYNALQSLQESEQLLHEVDEHYTQLGQPAVANGFRAEATHMQQRVHALHEAILQQATLSASSRLPSAPSESS